MADKPSPIVALPEVLTPAERKFITTAELQKTCLPLSRRAIYSLRKRGVIPSVELGGKVLFHLVSVEAALLRRQSGGGQ